VGTLPRCARCLRSVDRLDFEVEPRTLDHVYVAHCHGESESVRISYIELMRIARGGMAFTVAFSKTRAAEQALG
jgi:hypothetical protein